jgi:hypothetical protein
MSVASRRLGAAAAAAPLSRDDGKVNVLIVASSLWIGGAETVMRHLAQSIDQRRFNVTVCHLKERGSVGDELARAGIDIVGIRQSDASRVDYISFVKLLRVIRARRIHVVHTHTTHGLVDASLCKLVMPRLKVIHTFHLATTRTPGLASCGWNGSSPASRRGCSRLAKRSGSRFKRCSG